MADTVLSGTSGALYYKPAGTSVDDLAATAFPSTGSDITVGAYLGFQVNDLVTLTYPSGATTTGAIAAGDYYVLTYNATSGVMTVSATEGGSAETATAQPSGSVVSLLQSPTRILKQWAVFVSGLLRSPATKLT